MSASEWRTCPFCEKEKERLKGVLTVRDYEEKMKDFLHPVYETEETIRIDYDFGFDDDGIFSFYYGGECAVCGAEWVFRIKDSEPTTKSKFVQTKEEVKNNE